MKVLIVSFAFPPSNVIGAVRVGKLARYLDHRGHDVRVLTTDAEDDRSLPLDIARDRVVYTEYRERKRWLDYMAPAAEVPLELRPHEMRTVVKRKSIQCPG